MSNFSHNQNLYEQNSYSETESELSGSDNSFAVLAALQETQNILNILLQRVINTANSDYYIENTLQINPSESDKQAKENSLKYKTFNRKPEKEKHEIINELIKRSNRNDIKFNSSNLLVPSSVSTKENIRSENTNQQNSEIKSLTSNNQRFLKPSDISESNKNYSDLPDGNVDPGRPPIVYRSERSMVLEKEIVKDSNDNNISTALNRNENNRLTDLLPNPSKNSLESFQLIIERKLSLDLKTLTNKGENISEILLEQSTNTLERGLNKNKLSKSAVSASSLGDNKEKSYEKPHSDSFCCTTQNHLEPMVSTLEREIILRGETLENRKTTVLQLPPKSIHNSPSLCEKEMVGDDLAKTRAHILCECEQPGVAGGAVPIVISFTISRKQDQEVDENVKSETNMERPISKSSISHTENSSYKTKPSLIPKLTNSFKNSDRSNLLGRTEKRRCLVPSSSPEGNEEQNLRVEINISPMTQTLQERLKATTTLIRQKISENAEKPEAEKNKTGQNEKRYQLRFEDKSFVRQKRQKKLHFEFSKHINRVAEDATNLTEINNLTDQIVAIDNLYNDITELKRLTNEINSIQIEEYVKTCITDESQDMDENQPASIEPGNRTRTKDNNKIYIKFLPTKSGLKKKKGYNTEVQTESSKEFVSNIVKSDSNTGEQKSYGENGLKDVDSMDGIFIPSMEEPYKMEEDEDEDGLDITITFPEFQQHLMHQRSSHLSVCFSDISAEALCRLKRCPKEFTLRMDFVHGKMFFQSGNSPANNYSIGPDLKIHECTIDGKMSDIISIKPSTECMYTSQIIPVEGEKQRSSIRTLKSTDSELFNVVSLPRINRKTSGNTKSCITFKSERYSSARYLLSDRRSYKSMPQIPSLTRIIEEPAMESVSNSRAAVMNSDKKPKSRTVPKKKNNTSLDGLSET